MKKLILFISVVTLGSAVVSCKKDYKCKCTKTYTTSSSTYSEDDGNYTYKDTKAKATIKCDDNDNTGSDLAGDYTRNCEIQ
jgi:hypothetical protein